MEQLPIWLAKKGECTNSFVCILGWLFCECEDGCGYWKPYEEVFNETNREDG